MLEEKLANYIHEGIYPFHMPGHKRQSIVQWNPYEMDITEIDGFDDLHHASGILKEAQERAARLYGAKRSFYLVNGSTCGILAAICATAGRRKRILLARNCHRSAYHAAYLNELAVDYLYPCITEAGIQGQIPPESVRQKLEAAVCAKTIADIEAVVITSPTYDGVVSDVRAIAQITHEYEIPLIVDEAHGAHFGLSPYFPESAVRLGADIVIQSLHKTLPSFTQTALLHIGTDRVNEREIERRLDIFETSSPSYLFMAGMDACIRLLEERKDSLFEEYQSRLSDFYRKTERLRFLKTTGKSDFSKKEAYDIDESKIRIMTGRSGLTGKSLYDLLLKKYRLQMEMVSGGYVLALSSMMDTAEGFDRLAEALLEIDAACSPEEEENRRGSWKPEQLYHEQEKVLEIAEAQDAPREELMPEAAKGRIAASYLYLYPPGIPILVPGERITGGVLSEMAKCKDMELEIYGLSPKGGIEVVNFS